MHLSNLRVQDGPIVVFSRCPVLLASKVQDDFSDENAALEHCRKVVCEVSWVVLLRTDPIFDEAGSLHEGAE